MNEVDVVELVCAIVAVIIAGIALTIGSAALAIVIGIKNSTHQVVWKTMDEPKTEDIDPFSVEDAQVSDEPEINPNKKIKKQSKSEASEENSDLEDMTSTSNNWM